MANLVLTPTQVHTDNVLVMRGRHRLPDGQEVPREVRFWAERGLIHVEDSLDNSYQSLSVRQFLERVAALSDLLRNSRSSDATGPDAAYRSELLAVIEQAVQIARQAQLQGMPDDPSAVRDLLRRRPSWFVQPAREG